MTVSYLRSIILLGLDTFLAITAFTIATLLRYGDEYQLHLQFIINSTLTIAILAPFVFYLNRVSQTVWRYTSMKDLMNVVRASSYLVLLFLFTEFLHNRLEEFPRSVLVIFWLLLICSVIGVRVLYRLIQEGSVLQLPVSPNSYSRIPILLAGSDQNAELYLRKMLVDPTNDYRVVGILDKTNRRVGRLIHGVPVLGSFTDFKQVVKNLRKQNIEVRKLIISSGIREGLIIRELLEATDHLGISIGRLAPFSDNKVDAEGRVTIQPIMIGDLLGRKQNTQDLAQLNDLIKGKKILVTGAGGTIGSELVRQISNHDPAEICLVDISEFNLYSIEKEIDTNYRNIDLSCYIADVRDIKKLESIFKKHKPEIVFHAAALKHVPLVESNIAEGVKTNIFGTRNVISLATKFRTEMMVMISTDKAVNPVSVMGATKRIAEKYVTSFANSKKNLKTKIVTVRFGNVLGSSGSVIPLFEEQLKKGGPLTITHPDMVRYFMTVREAVELVLIASYLGENNRLIKSEIFVLDMGEPIRIYDLATQMIKMAGLRLEKDIRIVYTGLRKGEKLFEELFYLAEEPKNTTHEAIMSAKPEPVEFGTIENHIAEIEKSLEHLSDLKLKELLKKMIPEFNYNT